MLAKMGIYDVWLNQGVGNIQLFLSLFQHSAKINDNFLQNWYQRLNDSSRATFYVNIADFSPKVYLDSVKVLKFRTALARLRVSSHRLEIEAGRWARPYKPVSDRICDICNCLEDEYHFVLECQLYDSLRRKYIDQFYWNRPCMYKFVELINSSNFEILSNLDIYIYKAFKVRDGELASTDKNV